MTEKFPSFGALFDTIKFAFKDLAKFLLGLFVMFMGFFFTAYVLFGDKSDDFRSFSHSFMRLFYLLFGIGLALVNNLNSNSMYLSSIFFLIFMILFSFILLKMLVTIVIIRYKYLRSIVQLDNEANARIMKNRSKEFNKTIINFLL